MWTHTRIRRELLERVMVRASEEALSGSAFIERALESALGNDDGRSAGVPTRGSQSAVPSDLPGPGSGHPVSSRAPDPVVDSPAGPVKLSEVPRFVCRHGDFEAKSPKARCRRHGGALIPVE